jgi:hypothetical protein
MREVTTRGFRVTRSPRSCEAVTRRRARRLIGKGPEVTLYGSAARSVFDHAGVSGHI